MADELVSPDTRVVMTRKQARAAGLKRYFSGAACRWGHVAERYVSIGKCVVCTGVDARRWSASHPEKVKAAKTKYSAANPEKTKTRNDAYRAANPEKIKTRRAAYRAANPEKLKAQETKYRADNPEKRAAQRKVCRVNNLEREKAREAAYRAANREKRYAENDAWRANNPEKVRAINRNRHARKRMAEGHNSAEDIQRIYQAQKGKCAYCKTTVGKKYQIDHIQPLAKGGSNWPSNLQIVCGSCNARKRDRDPIEHARQLGLLL